VRDLLHPETKSRARPATRLIKQVSGITAAIAIAAAGLFATGAFAKDVSLSVGLDLNGEKRSMGLITAEGQNAEIRVEGLLKVLVVPTIQPDGRIMLAAKIYALDAGEYTLISEPKVLTLNHERAEIRLTSGRGEAIAMAITPSIQ
jgi:hypothetical protein